MGMTTYGRDGWTRFEFEFRLQNESCGKVQVVDEERDRHVWDPV
jgi:hypothetical protein